MANEPSKVVVNVDKACETVRYFIGGKASMAAVGNALAGATADQLEVISLATRVPVKRLETLRRTCQLSLI